MSPRTLMDNQRFITEVGLADAELVDLADISPMSVWKKFIGISEKPDRTIACGETEAFYGIFWDLLEANGVKSDERLLVSIGGDSSGRWIGISAGAFAKVWKSGLPQKTEIECAILLPDSTTIIGMTAEEGEEYWFFRREL